MRTAVTLRLDLHRHLEGSHSVHALATVARAHDVRTPVFYDEAQQRWHDEEELRRLLTLATPSDDAALFYACIVKARSAYANVQAVRELSLHAFREAADETDGFEMRLSLFSMTRTVLENRGIPWRTLSPRDFADAHARPILLAVLAARDEAQREAKKPMLVRLGLSRTFESEPHYAALADMVVDHASALVGLDVLGIVTGADTEPLPAPLVQLITRLRKRLPDLTIHAGEFAGAHSVERTLGLEPHGIGHGVRSLESADTLSRLVREGVTLEVCPTSNRLLIPTVLAALERAHGGETPLRALQQAHVHCVLGSDDPTPMRTSFAAECSIAHDRGVDLAQLERDSRRRWRQITGDDFGATAAPT